MTIQTNIEKEVRNAYGAGGLTVKVSASGKFNLRQKDAIREIISKKVRQKFSMSELVFGVDGNAINQRSKKSYAEILSLNKGTGFFSAGADGKVLVPKRDILALFRLYKDIILEETHAKWGGKRLTTVNYYKFFELLGKTAVQVVRRIVRQGKAGFPKITKNTIASRVTGSKHKQAPMFDTGDLLNALEVEIRLR